MRNWRRFLRLLTLLALAGCAAGGGAPATSLRVGADAVVVTANPLATEAGLDMLRRGGTAIDAAIAAQAVLGLVEPQASGMLGGSVILLWRPGESDVTVIDGMPTAPAAATRAVAQSPSGRLLDPRDVAFSPRAVGVPGTLPALWAAHQRQGKLPWASLFEPAEHLAAVGIAMPHQMHMLLTEPGAAQALGEVIAPYLGPDGNVIPEGAPYRNPPAASVLQRVARSGPEGLFAEGGIESLMTTLRRGPHASLITEADLRGAKPRITTALCRRYAETRLCTAPPPAMGGVVMLQTLLTVPAGDSADPVFVHRFLEASRLAEADRRRYLADPDFVDVPLDELLSPSYLAARFALIAPGSAIVRPRPGDLGEQEAGISDPGAPMAATSQIAVVDKTGGVISMTSTVNLRFGARRMSEGMVLNNELINFAPPPPTTFPDQADHYANEMAPGKRPLSPIAPVIAFDAQGLPILAGGGAGGLPIPDTVALAVMDVLANHRSLAETIAAGHVHAADPDHIVLEDGTEAAALKPKLEAIGHRVALEAVSTGNAFIQRVADGWIGAADPRRDGAAGSLR